MSKLVPGLIITAVVTSLTPSQFFNKDDSGNEIPGGKSILVGLKGGYSFQTKEGDDNFDDINDYVRRGMLVKLEYSTVIPVPRKQINQTSSGTEVEGPAGFFLNLADVELIDFEEKERNAQFDGREKKEPLVFAHKEGRPRRPKAGSGPEVLPETGEQSSTVY